MITKNSSENSEESEFRRLYSEWKRTKNKNISRKARKVIPYRKILKKIANTPEVYFQEDRNSAPGKRRGNKNIHDETAYRNKIRKTQTPEKENIIFISCFFVLFVVYSPLKIKPG